MPKIRRALAPGHLHQAVIKPFSQPVLLKGTASAVPYVLLCNVALAAEVSFPAGCPILSGFIFDWVFFVSR
jgi:hypothetical protein